MANSWKVGEKIDGRWEVFNVFKGGMGIVYIVVDHDLDASYAAKTFQEEVFQRDPRIAERFAQEALLWINLDNHANVAKARFVQTVNDRPFLFLEYVTGGDLSRWIGTSRLLDDVPQVLRFAIQFCDGMIHAASKGIAVHRDIKPQNCLVSDGILKVTDFGLARLVDAAPDTNDAPTEAATGGGGFFGRLWKRSPENRAVTPSDGPMHPLVSQTGAAAGTPTHMPPEQFASAKHVTVQADVYSFGIMLYQMITGKLPFVGKTLADYRRLHETEPPPPLPADRAFLGDIVRTCLAKNPSDRFNGFHDLRAALATVYQSVTGTSAPDPVSGTELDAADWDNKGVSLGELGLRDAELACYERALALKPTSVRVLANKGGALIQAQKYEQALECLNQATTLDPNDAHAWVNKASAYDSLGRIEEEMTCLEHACALAPRMALPWRIRGLQLASLKRDKEALACLDRALELDPGDIHAMNSKGLALSGLSRDAEAIPFFDRALELAPYAEAMWSNRGIALKKLGRAVEAITSYDRALERNPRFVEAWSNKGLALVACSRYDEAVACYDRAIALKPDFAIAWFNKGLVLNDQLPRKDLAITCFEEAKRLGSPEASVFLVRLRMKPMLLEATDLVKTERLADALTLFDRVLTDDPDCAEAWFLRATALLKMRRVADALQSVERAHTLGYAAAAKMLPVIRAMAGKS